MFRSDVNNTDRTISICIIAIAVSLYVFFKRTKCTIHYG